jgi:hypothetical protein
MGPSSEPSEKKTLLIALIRPYLDEFNCVSTSLYIFT